MPQKIDFQPHLLKESEAAKRLAVEVATLRRWRWAGKGPRFLKIEGAVRYDPNDLAEFISASRRNSTSDTGADSRSREIA
jgi:predicted site-specific integrase-resolvase